MKFCTSCGAQLEADYKFCFECGHPVKSTQIDKENNDLPHQSEEALDLEEIIASLESTGKAEDKELSTLIKKINQSDDPIEIELDEHQEPVDSSEKSANEIANKSDAHVIKEARGLSEKEAERVKKRRELLGSNESQITKSIVLEDEEKPKQKTNKSIKWIQGILIAIIIIIILLVGYLYLKNYYGLADSVITAEVATEYSKHNLMTILSIK